MYQETLNSTVTELATRSNGMTEVQQVGFAYHHSFACIRQDQNASVYKASAKVDCAVLESAFKDTW